MTEHTFARLLLKLRYNGLGTLANNLVKALFPWLWTALRDTAIKGHEPTREMTRGRLRPWPTAYERRANTMTVVAPGARARWIAGFRRAFQD